MIKGRGHGTGQCHVSAIHTAWKKYDDLVVRKKHEPMALEGPEIGGGQPARRDAHRADRYIGDVPDAIDERGSRILAPVFLECIGGYDGRMPIDHEVRPVAAASHSQMRYLRQVIPDLRAHAG